MTRLAAKFRRAVLALVVVGALPAAGIAWQAASRREPYAAFDALYLRMQPTKDGGFQFLPRRRALPAKRQHIDAGSAELASKYYADLDDRMGRPLDSFDALLDFSGYQGLRATDLEALDSASLNAPDQLARSVADSAAFAKAFAARPLQPGEILAARFFAPKTTDASRKVMPVAYSWRKIIRLQCRPGSAARQKGIDAVYILGNTYRTDLENDPFAKPLPSHQVILVTDADDAGATSMYFLLYASPATDRGARTAVTSTSWDARSAPAGQVAHDYHVPTACAVCHGLHSKALRLNFLDTDYYLDRTRDDDDFPEVARSRWGVLYDAGDKAGPQADEQAFAAIRALNERILEQNRRIDRKLGLAVPSFQTRSVQTWLTLHEKDLAHVPPFKRGLPGNPATLRWDESQKTDRELVTLLGRYCYKCHSSVAYNVFDKQAVLDKSLDMRDYIEAEMMPQDREIPEKDRVRLLELLERLPLEAAP